MKRRSAVLLLSVALFGLASASCGGGGGNVSGGMMGGALTPVFTPVVPNPMGPADADSITMTAGTVVGETFQIDIRVTDIVDFFGTTFRVTFDSGFAEFQSGDGGLSIVQVNSPDIDIQASLDPADADSVIVLVTLRNPVTGPIQGLDTSMEPTDLLITLTFRATNPVVGSLFGFGTAGTRNVTTCPAPPAACDQTIPDATWTWNGGSLTVTN